MVRSTPYARPKTRLAPDAGVENDRTARSLDFRIRPQAETVDHRLCSLNQPDTLASVAAESAFEMCPECVEVRAFAGLQCAVNVDRSVSEFLLLVDLQSTARRRKATDCFEYEDVRKTVTEIGKLALG